MLKPANDPCGAVEASASTVSVLGALLEARTGQRLAANRNWRIDTALKPLANERGLDTIDQLVAHLLDGQDASIGDRIVDALLNQETSFFRDAGVIESVVTVVAASGNPAPRIWSAGCATGQEPLSLAIAFAEAGGAIPEIVATDVSAAAIARTRAGRFNQFEIQRGLPIRRMMAWFEQAGEDWVASEALLKRIVARRHNLVVDYPPVGRFDAVLCRNVLFYLAPELRAQVLDRIAGALRPGGVLVLGAGETVIGQTDRFAPSKRFRGLYEVAEPAAAKVYFAG